MFTLEWQCENYEEYYWELDSVWSSFEEAFQEQLKTLVNDTKFYLYERSKICEWENGKVIKTWFYNRGVLENGEKET